MNREILIGSLDLSPYLVYRDLMRSTRILLENIPLSIQTDLYLMLSINCRNHRYSILYDSGTLFEITDFRYEQQGGLSDLNLFEGLHASYRLTLEGKWYWDETENESKWGRFRR